MNRKRFAQSIVVMSLTLALGFSYAEEPYLTLFYKGNLAEKNQIVKDAAEAGDGSIALQSLDFSISAYGALHGESEFITLAETSVKALTAGNTPGKEKEAAEKLRSVFKLFSEPQIKIAVLDAFSVFQAPENLFLVNDFFYEKMQNSADIDEALLKAVLYMGSYGNAASFNMLFIADILDVWPSYSKILANAYGSLADGSEKEILQLLATVPAERKIIILEKLSSNPKIAKKICGEAAENVLSSVIYSMEGSQDDSSGMQTELMLASLQIISDANWTRASKMATSCFDALRSGYESGSISDEAFSNAIADIASVASADTAKVLSSYLDFLNRSTEKKQPPAKAVVLSVINSLGELGDKNAFDCLLYATYLDYPEEVILSAKSALAKLKW
ncbi:MAG: hypothetical protein J6K96_08245 [Treponema sp.]|nr:hypothetical protein [Treponema sp.]